MRELRDGVNYTSKYGNHTDQLTSKLSKARYVIRAVQSFVSQETLRMIYFSYVHSITIYGAILRGIHLIAEIFLKIQKNNNN